MHTSSGSNSLKASTQAIKSIHLSSQYTGTSDPHGSGSGGGSFVGVWKRLAQVSDAVGAWVTDCTWLTLYWLIDDRVLIVYWLTDDCILTDCMLMTVCWLYIDRMSTVRGSYADCPLTVYWPYIDRMLTVCWPYVDRILTKCWLSAGRSLICMENSCQFLFR